MLFTDIHYLDENYHLVPHASVGVRDGRIAYLGTAPPADTAGWGRVIDGKERLLIPGFFNLHSHTAMTLLRGYGENLTLHDWLTKRIFPFEAHLNRDDIYWGTLLGCAEMLRYGIVSTSDMYLHTEAEAEAFLKSGVKANIAACVSCFDQGDYHQHADYSLLREQLSHYHGCADGRLQLELMLHAEYTSSEEKIYNVATAAAELGVGIHVHVSETASEVAGCQERHDGRTPVAYLADCGIFDVPVTAAHCVHLAEEDFAVLAQKNVNVATCPKSNLKLASGICPVEKLLAAGVNVALGTDSVSSNNNLDFIEEMRIFALLQKGISGDATQISTAQALAAATRCGAKAQRRADCGSIRQGNRADLVMLDISQPHMHPAHDLLSNLIYAASGSDVMLTMVDGVICYENGDWPLLDIEKIYAETEKSRLRILAELG